MNRSAFSMRGSGAALLALALVLGLSSAAGAYTGTSAGKKLAAQMLASYKHVRHLAGSQSGGVFYCMSVPGGVFVGPASEAPRTCRAPATDSWVANLSRGKGVSAVGTVSAHGKPKITWVTSRSGTFWRAGAGCWQKGNPDPVYVGSPPFGFFPNEHMSVGGHRGSNVLLVGTAPHFKETDTISSGTHEIVGEDIHFGIGTASAWKLETHYHNASKAPKVPVTKPTC